jgi:hypothetical protein
MMPVVDLRSEVWIENLDCVGGKGNVDAEIEEVYVDVAVRAPG